MQSKGNSIPSSKDVGPNSKSNEAHYPESPLQRVLPVILVEIWWKSRWNILGLLALGVAFWLGVLMLIPNQYRAESRVIILPPRFLPEARTEPLSVATANELLGSASILERVIQTLQAGQQALVKAQASPSRDSSVWAGMDSHRLAQFLDANALNEGLSDEQTSGLAAVLSRLSQSELQYLATIPSEDLSELTVDDIRPAFDNSTTVDQRTAVDIRLSPLIKLSAAADHPRKAQLLANVWALVFEQSYDSLSSSKTRRQYESILNQQRLSQDELKQAQEDLVQFKAKHNLELYLRQIEQYSDDFRDQSRQLLSKQNASRAQAGQLGQFLAMTSALQENGKWIGTLELSSTNQITTSAVNTNIGLEKQGLTSGSAVLELAIQTLQTRNQLAQAIATLDLFSEQSPVELLESSRNQYRQEFMEGSSRLRTAQLRLEQLSKTCAAMLDRLSTTGQAIELSTVPSVDAATMIIADSEEPTSLSLFRFEREELNPLWVRLTESLAAKQSEQDLVAAEVAGLTAAVPQRETAYRDMQTTYTKAQMASEFVRENLDRWKRAHDELFSAYVSLTNDTFNTARNLALVEEEVRNLLEATSRTRTLIDGLQQTYNEAAATQALLESRKQAVQRRAELLFQKLQDAQTAVAEEVSDVTVASHAVLPGRHYFPRRSLFLPALTLLSGMIILGFITWNQRLRLIRS